MSEAAAATVFAVSVENPRAARRIRAWLITIALFICAMVMIGGATRLTDSGLSITEWRPVSGVLLPLSEEAWLEEFIRYQGIPEYQIVNQGMSIDEFKTIYAWEWVHRNFGRLIAVAFLLPLAYFVAAGAARGRLAARLAAIFLIGGAQGLAGWYMVQSGLEEGVDVSQYRLAVHLVLAFLILGAILWTVFDLSPRTAPRRGPAPRGALSAAILLGGVLLQVIAGAFVAGLRAGRSYNTWPLMDGALIPDGLAAIEPWYLNLSENVLTVQFDHRMLAYLLLAAALAHWRLLPAELRKGPAGTGALAVMILIALQIALGVATVILAAPLALGLLHQAGALAVFAAALHHLHHLHRLRRGAAQDSAQAAASA